VSRSLSVDNGEVAETRYSEKLWRQLILQEIPGLTANQIKRIFVMAITAPKRRSRYAPIYIDARRMLEIASSATLLCAGRLAPSVLKTRWKRKA